ncbi:MAG: hypothetical protein ACK5MV_14570 [Aminipila sp.]
MSKGNKMIKEMLHNYSFSYGEDFSSQRNLYYDILAKAQENIQANLESNTSKGVEILKIQVEDLKKQNNRVADVLEDVEAITKYEV